jgi:UDP-glucose 4-epimerase
VLAAALGRKPRMNLMPMQPGDVQATYADIEAIERDYGWRPTTTIERGCRSWWRGIGSTTARERRRERLNRRVGRLGRAVDDSSARVPA